jgi:hypothetical protein
MAAKLRGIRLFFHRLWQKMTWFMRPKRKANPDADMYPLW